MKMVEMTRSHAEMCPETELPEEVLYHEDKILIKPNALGENDSEIPEEVSLSLHRIDIQV